MNPAIPLPTATCPFCGGPNDCAPARCGSFDTPCWCAAVAIPPELLARVPEEARGRACVCARCAEEAGAVPRRD